MDISIETLRAAESALADEARQASAAANSEQIPMRNKALTLLAYHSERARAEITEYLIEESISQMKTTTAK